MCFYTYLLTQFCVHFICFSFVLYKTMQKTIAGRSDSSDRRHKWQWEETKCAT